MKTYRSPKIGVHEDSLEGRGVVALQDIAREEVVAVKVAHLITRDEIEQITAEVGDYALQIDDNFYLSPRNTDEIDDMSVFINHSCDPNIGFRGQVVYVAMRDIRAGEELCHDYSMERSDNYALDCHCGSSLCRGKVTGQDWKIPELQRRYRDYFSIYLSNKIRRG